MYQCLRELWSGFTKNVYLGARGDVGAIALGAAFCAALSIAPPLLALDALRRKRPLEALEAAMATAAVIAVARHVAPYAGISRRLAVYAPLGIAAFAAIALNSTRRALFGVGFEWRGRSYPARTD